MSKTIDNIDIFIIRHGDKFANAVIGNFIATVGMVAGLMLGHALAGSIIPVVVISAWRESFGKEQGGKFNPSDMVCTILGGCTIWVAIVI